MAEKILNTQKSIAGQKEGAGGSSGGKEYEVSTNVARDLDEVKRTRMYVEKNDGTNISGIIIPHHVQIGINDQNFESDLGVKGDLKVDGEIFGTHTKLEDGETNTISTGIYLTDVVETDPTKKGQIVIQLNVTNSPANGQVLSYDSLTTSLKFIDVVGGAIAFLFASSITQFAVGEMSMTAFGASNAFDPRTNGTTEVASVSST